MRRGIALLFIVALYGCSANDDDPARVKVFELEVKDNYPVPEESWVIVSDQDGKVVGSSTFTSGSSIVFDEPSVDVAATLNVTFLRCSKLHGAPAYYAKSYTDVPSGSKWFLKSPISFFPDEPQQATVSIADLPESSVTISSTFSRNILTLSTTGGSVESAIDVHGNNEVFISAVGQHAPKFLKTLVTPGTKLSLDYNTDLVPFDHTVPAIDVSIDDFTLNVQGYMESVENITDPLEGRHLFAAYQGNSKGLRVGYNDGYETYLTQWTGTTEQATISYKKVGSPADELSFYIPTIDPRITSASINNFEMTGANGLHSATLTFELENLVSSDPLYIEWEVYRPRESQSRILNQFPPDILGRHPGLFDTIERAWLTEYSYHKVVTGPPYPFSGYETEAILTEEEVFTFRFP